MEIFSLPQFEKTVKRLRKHYPNVENVIAALVAQLKSGILVGDKIPNIEAEVYKVRLPNPDAQKGKQGGFRIIYYLRYADVIWLLTMYAKSDQSDVSTEFIRKLIEEYDSFDDGSDNNPDN